MHSTNFTLAPFYWHVTLSVHIKKFGLKHFNMTVCSSDEDHVIMWLVLVWTDSLAGVKTLKCFCGAFSEVENLVKFASRYSEQLLSSNWLSGSAVTGRELKPIEKLLSQEAVGFYLGSSVVATGSLNEKAETSITIV